MTRFDNLLLAAEQGDSSKTWSDALALVGDAALVCRAWFEEHTLGFTTADLMRMTELVMTQERDLIRRNERLEDLEEPTL